MEINNIIDAPKQKLNDKTALSGLGALSHSQEREREIRNSNIQKETN